jgi:hypothetical protein
VESLPKSNCAFYRKWFSKVNKLPMEFAFEAQKLLEISLEGSVG